MAVMMGRELEKYEITSITLTRNDDVTQRFAARLQELEMRAPKLDETPHWRKTPEAVVSPFGRMCCRIAQSTLNSSAAGCCPHRGSKRMQGGYREGQG